MYFKTNVYYDVAVVKWVIYELEITLELFSVGSQRIMESDEDILGWYCIVICCKIFYVALFFLILNLWSTISSFIIAWIQLIGGIFLLGLSHMSVCPSVCQHICKDVRCLLFFTGSEDVTDIYSTLCYSICASLLCFLTLCFLWPPPPDSNDWGRVYILF